MAQPIQEKAKEAEVNWEKLEDLAQARLVLSHNILIYLKCYTG